MIGLISSTDSEISVRVAPSSLFASTGICTGVADSVRQQPGKEEVVMIRSKLLLGVTLLFFSINIIALPQKESEKTIPFATYTYISGSIPRAVDRSGKPPIPQNQNEVIAIVSSKVDISVNKISDFVKEIRESICTNVGDADVRVWLSLDTQAKMLLISTNMQGGIEVTFHCKPHKQK